MLGFRIFIFIFKDQTSVNILNEIPQFNSDFQFVVENCTNEQLMHLVAIEQDMTKEMKSLIAARDYDLERLRKACEETVEKTSEMTDQIEEHSYNLSILNEKLRVSTRRKQLNFLSRNAPRITCINGKQ